MSDRKEYDGASQTVSGSCLCGGVAYRASGPFTLIARCHCTQCRKGSGAEYATNATVEGENFELLRGSERLREFSSSEGQYRVFCGDCGSPMYKRTDKNPDQVRLRLGCLDDDLDVKIQVRVFTSEKLGVTVIPNDDCPTFETVPGA